MYIEKELDREHSKEMRDNIIQYVNNDKNHFAELMHVFLRGNRKLSQRAAWPMSFIVSKNPSLFTPYFDDCFELLSQDVHPAIKRNILRSLQVYEIPEDKEGPIFDICYELAYSNLQPIAIRAFSLTVLFNIVRKHRDLLEEFKILLDSIKQVPQSAGMKSRIRNIEKEIAKKF